MHIELMWRYLSVYWVQDTPIDRDNLGKPTSSGGKFYSVSPSYSIPDGKLGYFYSRVKTVHGDYIDMGITTFVNWGSNVPKYNADQHSFAFRDHPKTTVIKYWWGYSIQD